ncbi:WD40 repeat-like protein [Suillus brevipes Sb2]|nr:WD40 repeat-like protein [Suillus brevipes Sb2]
MSSSTSKMPVIMPRQTMRGHTKEVRGVVHLPGERQIITYSIDGSLRLWDLENGTQIGEDWRNGINIDAVWSMALSPNGKMIATGSGVYDDKRLWDVETRKVIAKWEGHTGAAFALCWSADGERVASGSSDGTARVWDVDSGKNILRLWDVETRKVIAKWEGHTGAVCALCWSADGERVASGSWDGTARVWDVNSGKNILTIKTGHQMGVGSDVLA